MRKVHWTKTLPLLAVGLLLGSCGTQYEVNKKTMLVAASIAPMAHFARQVGGNHVEVRLMVPPQASPHTYQPTPGQMKALSRASVLVLNGVGLEFWAEKAINATANPRLIVVHTAKGLPLAQERDSDHPEGNPHVWLNPKYAIHQVNAIRNAYIQADPKHARDYRANASAFVKRLKELDREIREKVKLFRTKKFVAFHPAWVYFAREYGLEQAAVIEESAGKEPSPAHMRKVIRIAKELNAKAIFAEPQFSQKVAEVVAEESGARVLLLDPLGKPPDYNYINTMRSNLRQMELALR